MKVHQFLLLISIPVFFICNSVHSENIDKTTKSKKVAIKNADLKLKRINKPQASNHKHSGPLKINAAEKDKSKLGWGLDWNLITLIVGILMLLIQQGMLHKSRLKVQEDSLRQKLKLEIYENIADTIDRASNTIGKVSVDVLSRSSLLEKSSNIPTYKHYFDLDDVTSLFNEAVILTADVIIILEKYAIALQKFKIFRLAIDTQADILLHHFSEVAQLYINNVKVDNENDGKAYLLFNQDQLKILQDKSQIFMEEATELKSYLQDLQTDAQNELLLDLFKNQVSVRKPYDQKYKAVSVKYDVNELVEYLRGRAINKRRFNRILREFENL